MKKMMLLMTAAAALGGGLLEATAGSDPLREVKGIERIDPHPAKYAYLVNGADCGWLPSYGYHFEGNAQIRSQVTIASGARCNAVYEPWLFRARQPPSNVTTRTLTGDIRNSMLDQGRFDLALSRHEYANAWEAGRKIGGTSHPQGALWMEIAAGKAKSKTEKWTKQGILEEDAEKTHAARQLIESFRPLDAALHQELLKIHEEAGIKARRLKDAQGAGGNQEALVNSLLRLMAQAGQTN